MSNLLLSIIVAVSGSVLYHVGQKSVSAQASALLSLAVAFTIAAVSCLLLFFVTDTSQGFAASLKKLNWASFVLGISFVIADLGYLFSYRMGGDLTWTSIVINVLTTLFLILIGMFLFREHLSGITVLGIILCIAGLSLIRWSIG